MNLGNYRFLAQVGASEDGPRYRAERKSDGSIVEVRLLGGAHADPARWAQISRRLRLSALVDHPQVVRIRSLNLASEPPYVALDWLETRTLMEGLGGARPLSR
jgi:hypothetical protein